MKTSYKILILTITQILILSACNHAGNSTKIVKTVQPEDSTVSIKPELFLDFNLDTFRVEKASVRSGQTMGNLLYEQGFSSREIYDFIQKIDSFYNVKHLKKGQELYWIFRKNDTLKPDYLVLKENSAFYRIFDLDSLSGNPYREFHIPLTFKEKEVSLRIENSLFADLERQGLSPVLALKLSDIYAWTVDFFHLQKHDGFKVIYNDVYADTTYMGVGNIKASVFYHYGDTLYAFRYEFDTINHLYDYFDEKGRTLRKQFLKSPIKFGRISSRYTMRRYVKIYGRIKPHLGTDFAAPVGTPIMATADGVVIKASYTRGNGNYVKIRHNSTYSTQYLHMKSFAKGIRPGVRVKQGQVIGYVGMTGYTTGPHVCYRFWKNGRQVDPFKQKLPEAKSLDSSKLQAYFDYIKPLKKQLDSIPLN